MIMASMRNWLSGGALDGGRVEDDAGGDGHDGDGDGDSKDKKREKKKKIKKDDRVVVVHCKAGKGRSGSMACSYLISECGWAPEDALARFTERRMRPRFGAGVSIPSQLRWISYVDRWTKGGKRFADRPVEVLEVHVWGLRHGVKVSVEGFADEGKRIEVLHTFTGDERIVVEAGAPGGAGIVDLVSDMAGYGIAGADDDDEIVEDADYRGIARGQGIRAKGDRTPERSSSKASNGSSKASSFFLRMTNSMPKATSSNRNATGSPNRLSRHAKSRTITIPDSPASSPNPPATPPPTEAPGSPSATFASASEPGGQAVVFRPRSPIRLAGGDVKVALERRNRAPRLGDGWTVVTAVAHAWFNAFFEGGGAEAEAGAGAPDESGVFEVPWEGMDGIKGSSRKGAKACDRVAVVWRFVGEEGGVGTGGAGGQGVVGEPALGGPVPQMRPADWKGANEVDPEGGKRLGLRAEEPDSVAVSKASSIRSQEGAGGEGTQPGPGAESQEDDSIKGVKTSGPSGEEILDEPVGAECEVIGTKHGKEQEGEDTGQGRRGDTGIPTAQKGFIVE